MEACSPTYTEGSSQMLSAASRVSNRAVQLSGRSRSRAHRGAVRLLAALGLLVAVSGLLASGAGADSTPTACNRFAAPDGSDAATGSAAAPFRTASMLASSLTPGQVGCLRSGTYGGGLRINHGGSPGAPIVLRSYPGERALITGRMYVPQGSDYVTFADLSFDGNLQSGSERLPSPTVDANHVTFESDDVTNDHTEICFDIGSSVWGKADSTYIVGNRIHDCGVIPATNHQHGIYVQDATNTHVVGNLISHNADRGIQLYPSSTGGVITDNVISENGEGVIFSGAGGVTSSGNLLERNLVVNSLIRSDVESWYPSGTPQGVGNLVRSNCVSARGIDSSSGGFSVQANVTAASGELSPTAAGGYRPLPGSACASVLALPPTLGEGAASGTAPVGVLAGSGSSIPAPVLVDAGDPAATAKAAPARTAAPTNSEVSSRSTVKHRRHRKPALRHRRGRRRRHAPHASPRGSARGLSR